MCRFWGGQPPRKEEGHLTTHCLHCRRSRDWDSELPLQGTKQQQWHSYLGFPGGTVVKNPPANAGDAKDAGLIPGSERSPGGGHGNPRQCSCLENLMHRGATVHEAAKSWTQLSTHAHTNTPHTPI